MYWFASEWIEWMCCDRSGCVVGAGRMQRRERFGVETSNARSHTHAHRLSRQSTTTMTTTTINDDNNEQRPSNTGLLTRHTNVATSVIGWHIERCACATETKRCANVKYGAIRTVNRLIRDQYYVVSCVFQNVLLLWLKVFFRSFVRSSFSVLKKKKTQTE